MKLVPGDWGPNFGHQWHDNEAHYWACRLGQEVDTVRAWQKAADAEGFIQDLVIASIDEKSVVLIEEVQGTANCHSLSALLKDSGDWRKIWAGPERLAGEDEGKYCTGPSGAIKLRIQGKLLTLEVPDCADPSLESSSSCKHVEWSKESYRWIDTTFVRSPQPE